MCEFCTQHGEGKKWYLQAKNYEQEVLRGATRRGMADNLERREENQVNRYIEREKQVASGFETARAMAISQGEQQRKLILGQIVPLEDALQILDLSTSVVLNPPSKNLIRPHW